MSFKSLDRLLPKLRSLQSQFRPRVWRVRAGLWIVGGRRGLRERVGAFLGRLPASVCPRIGDSLDLRLELACSVFGRSEHADVSCIHHRRHAGCNNIWANSCLVINIGSHSDLADPGKEYRSLNTSARLISLTSSPSNKALYLASLKGLRLFPAGRRRVFRAWRIRGRSRRCRPG